MVVLVARGVCVHIHALDYGKPCAVLAVAHGFLQSCSPTLATYLFLLCGGGVGKFLLFRLALEQVFYVAVLMCSSCSGYMKTRFEDSLESTTTHRLPFGLWRSCQCLRQNNTVHSRK